MHRTSSSLSIVILLSLMLFPPACSDDPPPQETPMPGPYAGMVPAGKMMDEILGISSHMSRGVGYSWKREFEIEKLVEAGVSMVRNDFRWNRVEPADDAWNLDGYSMMTDLCLEAGMDVTAIFHEPPEWAAACGNCDLIDADEFADYTGHVAAEFADRIDHYEIFNEQNTTRFWHAQPNADHFGTILKAGYEAIHTNDPDAVVIFGGLSTFETHFFHPFGVWNYLYRVYEAHPDICNYFDAMSIHPYTFLQQPSPEHDLDLGVYYYPDTVGLVDLVRDILGEIGCPDKPIQFTEVGWPSLIIGDRRQAAYLSRSVMLALAEEVDYYDWYTFWDGSGGASLPTEDYFGLFTYPDGEVEPEPKPSYGALLGVHQVLGDSRYAGDLGATLGWTNDLYALVFAEDDGPWTVGLWRGGPALAQKERAVIPIPDGATGAWTLFGQDGCLVDAGETVESDLEVDVGGNTSFLQFQIANCH